MSLVSTTAQTASLNNDYGATKGSHAAASHTVHLFNGDPTLSGTELTSAGGYVAPTVTNNGTNWPGASGGSTTSAAVTFATSSGAWSDTATHFLLRDASTGDDWDSGPLDVEVDVAAAGTIVAVALTVSYASL